MLPRSTTPSAADAPIAPVEAARRRHYGAFYGLDPLPEDDGRPLAIVLGNCQAESLRVLLGEDRQASLRTVRVPPVFELTADDLPHLARLLDRVDVLVSQPVRADYRDLPIGTAQIMAGLRGSARLVLVPPLRYAGLYPRHVIVRSGPAGDAGDPPLAPYHDLATALIAAGESDAFVRVVSHPSAVGIRAVARTSIAEVERRERRHGTVVASDLIAPAGADAAHTINHPGNTVLIGLARRVQQRLGLPAEAADPGRTLLRSIHAPLTEGVCAALDLPNAAVRMGWTIDGRAVPDEAIRDAHLAWYAHHPGLAEHVLAARAEALAQLRA